MVDPERDESPSALDSVEDDDTQDESSVAELSESAEDARIRAREKQLEDRLAQQGRRTAAAEARAEQAAQAIVAMQSRAQMMEQRLQQMGSYITQEQQRQNEAMLASLPPERRMEVKIQQLERQIAGAQRQPMPPPQPQAQRQAVTAEQIEARKREILQEVSREFGIRLSGQEQHIDHESEAGYRASLRAIAAYARDVEDDEPPAQERSVAKKAAPKAKSSEEIIEEAQKRVLQELGVTRSGAPSAIAGIAASAPSDVEKIMKTGSSREGPHKRLEALRKLTGRS